MMWLITLYSCNIFIYHISDFSNCISTTSQVVLQIPCIAWEKLNIVNRITSYCHLKLLGKVLMTLQSSRWSIGFLCVAQPLRHFSLWKANSTECISSKWWMYKYLQKATSQIIILYGWYVEDLDPRVRILTVLPNAW